MKTKTTILFLAEDVTLAHSSRAYVLASHIDPERYDIHFATSGKSRFLINSTDINFHEICTLASQKFIDRLRKGHPVFTVEELQRSVAADIELIKKLKPKLVIGDFRLSLGISAELTGTPYVALTNAHWSPSSSQPFPVPEHWFFRLIGLKAACWLFSLLEPAILWYHARAFNKVRQRHSLPSVGNLKEVYTHSSWTLFTDIPSIAPTHKTTDNQRYIGPVIWSPEIAPPTWWPSLADKSPLVYVTMGSSGDTTLLENILNALRCAGCIALVATAGRIKIELSPGVYPAEYLPGIEIIKKASLVICNGGSATAYQALSLGVPVLGIPSNADQFFTMESIARCQAGLLLRPGDASNAHVKTLVEALLGDETFKKKAMLLAEEISRYDSRTIFTAFIDELTTASAP